MNLLQYWAQLSSGVSHWMISSDLSSNCSQRQIGTGKERCMQDESIGGTSSAQPIEVKLDDGTIFYVQARTLGGESPIGIKAVSFEKVTQAIEGIARKMSDTWKKVEPDKAAVELGVEFAWESGDLLAVFVDSSTTASMKITLEWNSKPSSD